jgi:co-chaperonin GroES (HSP10)
LPGTDVSHIKKGDIVYYDSRQAYTLVIKEETVTIIQEHAIVVVE